MEDQLGVEPPSLHAALDDLTQLADERQGAAVPALRILRVKPQRPRLGVKGCPRQRTNLAGPHAGRVEPPKEVHEIPVIDVRQHAFEVAAFKESLASVLLAQTRHLRSGGKRAGFYRERERALDPFQLAIDGSVRCLLALSFADVIAEPLRCESDRSIRREIAADVLEVRSKLCEPVLRQKRVQLGRRPSVLVISDADRLCQAESPASVGFGSLWKDACMVGLMATEREG